MKGINRIDRTWGKRSVLCSISTEYMNVEKDGRMKMEIEEKLVNLLIERQWKISFAESCTGGMATSRIVSVSNASKILNCSFITYSNEAKMKYVGVNKSTLEKYGAVSEEVAKEMAVGALINGDAHIGVGISGIAGPSGGSKEKSVGTVCFGIIMKEKVYSYTKHFANQSRNEVRHSSVQFILHKLVELLESRK